MHSYLVIMSQHVWTILYNRCQNNIMEYRPGSHVLSLRIVGRRNMLCITANELLTFLKSSSDLKNLKVTYFCFGHTGKHTNN